MIRCACGNILGQTVPTGQVAVRYRGRELVGFMTAIRCEKCGRVWPPDLTEMQAKGSTARD